MRQKFVKGTFKQDLNDEIIKDCKLEGYSSRLKILKYFHDVDTYKCEDFWRLQGYVYAETVANEEIYVPPCEVSWIDGNLILFFAEMWEIKT